MSSATDVIIVGAGLTGLACAKKLKDHGISFTILEASRTIGGRVQTDCIDGFLLDHGFQVFLTAYPEAQRLLNYEQLNLQNFFSGALVRFRGRFFPVADPYRHPFQAFRSFFGPISTTKDKWLILKLRRDIESLDFSDFFPSSQNPASHALCNMGFSDAIMTRFFRPFFGGVFNDWNLQTPESIFKFVFSMFAKGPIAIPAKGMGAISSQLASNLSQDSIKTQSKISCVKNNEVFLESGESIKSRAVVIATDQAEAEKLIGSPNQKPSQKSYCLYYTAKEPPFWGPFLMLNGDGIGPINHLCVISQVAKSYAPGKKALISVTVLRHGNSLDTLESRVRQQLLGWFGHVVTDWRFMKIYINVHTALTSSSSKKHIATKLINDSNVFLCGDYFHSPTHHGALLSGRKTAESVMAYFN